MYGTLITFLKILLILCWCRLQSGIICKLFVCSHVHVHACSTQCHTVHLCYHWHSTFDTNSPGDGQRLSYCVAEYQNNTILLQILTPKTHHTLANYRTKVSKSLKLERLDQRKPISKVQMSSHNQFQLFGVRGQFTVGWDLFTIVGRSLLWTVAVTLYNNLNCPGFIFVRGTVYNYTGSISI